MAGGLPVGYFQKQGGNEFGRPPNRTNLFLLDFSMHYLHRNIYYTHSQQQQITDTHELSVLLVLSIHQFRPQYNFLSI